MSSAREGPLGIELRGTRLIEASAGTGKTHTITSLFLRLVLEGTCSVDEILVVTFTEAATAELRERIRTRLREALSVTQGDQPVDTELEAMLRRSADGAFERLSAALRRFDEAAIFTIHGFCRRMLLECAFESSAPFDAELLTDQTPLVREVTADFWSEQLVDAPGYFLHLLDEEGIRPSGLMDLVRQVVAHPDREPIPRLDQAFEPPAALRPPFERARRLWIEHRDEIRRLLATSRGLYRRVYTRPQLATWLEQVDAYLGTERPEDVALPTGVRRLAASAIGARTNRGAQPPAHPFFDACEALSRVPQNQLLAFYLQLARYATDEFARRKAERGLVSFDDLLHMLDAALSGPEAGPLIRRIRARFRAALIDEFQDTDQVQYRIFHRLFGERDAPLVLIGDPKQSIYAFRGADVFAYLQAVEQAGGHRTELAANWRSDPKLIRGINRIFSGNPRPFFFDRIAFRPVAPRPGARDRFAVDGRPAAAVRIRFVRRQGLAALDAPIEKGMLDELLPRWVAGDICRLLSGRATIDTRPIEPQDMAVLVRTNRQATQMQASLRRLGIPTVRLGEDSVFRTREADELATLLWAVAEAGRIAPLKAALATDLLGRTAKQIWDLQQQELQLEEWVLRFRAWRTRWERQGFVQMFRDVLAWRPGDQGRSAQARLLSLPDGERRMTDLRHLAELLHAASVQHQLGIEGLLRWFARQRSDPRPSSDATQVRLESDRRALKVVTIHKSKGLEYPVVYCPYLWDGRLRVDQPVVFHDPHDAHRPKLDLGSERIDSHRALAERDAFAENLRLAYVALTRARHLCVMVWGAFADMATSPLAYLLHGSETPADLDALRQRIATCSDETLLTDLNQLVEDTAGAIEVGPFEDGREPIYEPEMEPYRVLSCPSVERDLARLRRTFSFSALVEREPYQAAAGLFGRDHDESLGREQDGPAVETDGAKSNKVRLWAFEPGERTGNLLHAVLEALDFTLPDRTAFETLVADKLTTFGFDADRWQATVCRAVEEVLHTALDPNEPDLKLCRISHRQRLSELEFLIPAEHPATSGEALAEAFARHGGPAVPTDYPERLARLVFEPVSGFLKGYVDLVFEYRGRYFVVDYKTNFLGEHYADYAPAHLRRAMTEHHYHLQVHLYALALQRYLRLRLPGFDPKQHFGGAYYLFVRGMSPATGPSCGVFQARPADALVEGLQRLFGIGDVARGEP